MTLKWNTFEKLSVIKKNNWIEKIESTYKKSTKICCVFKKNK